MAGGACPVAREGELEGEASSSFPCLSGLRAGVPIVTSYSKRNLSRSILEKHKHLIGIT